MNSIEFTYDNEKRFNSQIEITLYRIVCELINNTLKHAMANKVEINLSHKYDMGYIQLIYSDDGKGFNLEKVIENKKGLGLNNMIQRVATLKGSIKFDTQEGNPLLVTIELPIINEVYYEQK